MEPTMISAVEVKAVSGQIGPWGLFLESPETPVVKLVSSCFETLIFCFHVFNVRKTKRIAKSDRLQP